MSPNAKAIVTDSAKRLFPGLSTDEVLASLLFERAQRNLIKYQSQARYYETKYRRPFDEFRQFIVDGEPGEEEERDYALWEYLQASLPATHARNRASRKKLGF